MHCLSKTVTSLFIEKNQKSDEMRIQKSYCALCVCLKSVKLLIKFIINNTQFDNLFIGINAFKFTFLTFQ
jgi:hypothetical protein